MGEEMNCEHDQPERHGCLNCINNSISNREWNNRIIELEKLAKFNMSPQAKEHVDKNFSYIIERISKTDEDIYNLNRSREAGSKTHKEIFERIDCLINRINELEEACNILSHNENTAHIDRERLHTFNHARHDEIKKLQENFKILEEVIDESACAKKPNKCDSCKGKGIVWG